MEIVEEALVIGIHHRHGLRIDADAGVDAMTLEMDVAVAATAAAISEIQQDADVLAADVNASEEDVSGADVIV